MPLCIWSPQLSVALASKSLITLIIDIMITIMILLTIIIILIIIIITIIQKNDKCKIIDFAVPYDSLLDAKMDKIEKYPDFAGSQERVQSRILQESSGKFLIFEEPCCHRASRENNLSLLT